MLAVDPYLCIYVVWSEQCLPVLFEGSGGLAVLGLRQWKMALCRQKFVQEGGSANTGRKRLRRPLSALISEILSSGGKPLLCPGHKGLVAPATPGTSVCLSGDSQTPLCLDV